MELLGNDAAKCWAKEKLASGTPVDEVIDEIYRARVPGSWWTVPDAIELVTGHRAINVAEVYEFLDRLFGHDGRRLALNNTIPPIYRGHRGSYYLVRDLVRGIRPRVRKIARANRRRRRREEQERWRRMEARQEAALWAEGRVTMREILRRLSRPRASRSRRAASRRRGTSGTS